MADEGRLMEIVKMNPAQKVKIINDAFVKVNC